MYYTNQETQLKVHLVDKHAGCMQIYYESGNFNKKLLKLLMNINVTV